MKWEYAALVRATETGRFRLDRLCPDDDALRACDVDRVRAVTENVAHGR